MSITYYIIVSDVARTTIFSANIWYGKIRLDTGVFEMVQYDSTQYNCQMSNIFLLKVA